MVGRETDPPEATSHDEPRVSFITPSAIVDRMSAGSG
jgi:hypothetical protein